MVATNTDRLAVLIMVVEAMMNSPLAAAHHSRKGAALRRRRGPRGSSEYRGVCRTREAHRWRAVIYTGRKQTYLGVFDTQEQAAERYHVAFKLLNRQTCPCPGPGPCPGSS
jgi:hypothetical protein